MLDALLTAYDFTHDAAVLKVVQDAVTELYNPGLGLYNPSQGAFYFAVNADGSGLQRAYMETRQCWMVVLLDHLNADDSAGGWSKQAAQMTLVTRDRFYKPDLQGYVYRLNVNFSLHTAPEGPNRAVVTENWVTAEADGIGCDALMAGRWGTRVA